MRLRSLLPLWLRDRTPARVEFEATASDPVEPPPCSECGVPMFVGTPGTMWFTTLNHDACVRRARQRLHDADPTRAPKRLIPVEGT